MSQENPKRRVSRICESLAQELEKVGLADKVELRMTNDPYADLESIHRSLLEVVALPQLPEYVQNNEIVMLESLKYLTTANEELSRFSRLLYEQEYSIEISKAFRKLYESISNVCNSLYGFESDDEAFQAEKEELINKNMQICQEMPHSQHPSDSQSQHTGNQNQQKVIDGLKQELAELHRLI